ncbi:MAG: hypothetical protein DSZ05_03445 [Sulfurospirillum sp.]|nr:MAG: hypothetical protein DSZ05_03445 [Sulfurospirillum sp.]
MWKYILIALFILLAIREINLMNQSLYIAPDNKIVAEDRTTATQLKKLIKRIKHDEFLLKEPETIEEVNISSRTEEKTQRPEPGDKEKGSVPSQELMQMSQPLAKQNITDKTETTILHEDEEKPTLSEQTKQPKIEKKTVTRQDQFESAEEKVRRILAEMKAAK